jgi:3-methyladenine DNA glycosylase AlkD
VFVKLVTWADAQRRVDRQAVGELKPLVPPQKPRTGRLNARATAATREWWAKHLRGAASFRGVKMGVVRTAVHAWFEEEQVGERLSVGQQKDLALMLLEEDYTEDKLAGVRFLQEIFLPAGALDWRSDLPRFARLFDEGYISDWNVCDWFCVKVLGPLAEQQGEACARAISEWREADGVWRRRASVVAFANLASKGDRNFPGFTEPPGSGGVLTS